MQVTGAYILVVLIWSTTPLAIHWSNSSLTFVTAIGLRMLLAFVCCYAILRLSGDRLIYQRRDWGVYAASALGLFPNMLLVYWAAQSIPSGLMSVIMGLYPFCVGVFSLWILRENPFTRARIVAVCLALLGLWVVHSDQARFGDQAMWGVAAMALVCVLWGFSSVLVKKLGAEIGPLRHGTGSVAVALPFFALAWWWLDGVVPTDVDHQSLTGVVYLTLAGSLVGHTLWFYVLRECSVVSVSLITLMTPVLALSWGVLLANETLAPSTLVGAALIVISLALYQGVFPKLVRLLRVAVNVLAIPAWTRAAQRQRDPTPTHTSDKR